mgnify:CR=1 FL=1
MRLSLSALFFGLLVAQGAMAAGDGTAAVGGGLGGALGNIVDRVRFGYVVDYADLHFGEWRPFLVFNVADAAITIGVLILLIRALFVREKPKADDTGAPVENANA